MQARKLMKRLAALGLSAGAWCLAMSATAAQGSASAAAQHTIRVLSVTGVDAASPEAAIWKKAPATQVSLQPAFPGHPAIKGVPVVERLTAQAVRVKDRLFLKLAWSDRTANTAIDDLARFADGAAVQFPINAKASTSPFMGDSENAVNVWYWRADGRIENLIANGYGGTSSSIPLPDLRSTAVRRESGWEVVISRHLRVKQQEGITLSGRKSIPVAFAAWDGDNRERDGLKAVTLEWWQLRF